MEVIGWGRTFNCFQMDNAEDENLWTTSDTNHQFYGNQYQVGEIKLLFVKLIEHAASCFSYFQPMQQQGFDLQREMHHQQQQPASESIIETT